MTDRTSSSTTADGNISPGRQQSGSVLLVTRNFPPLRGGMEKLNQHLLIALQPMWSIVLCGPAGCSAHAPPGAEVCESRVKPLPAFLVGTLWRAIRLARRRRPDWIVAGSGLTAPIAWLAAKSCGARFAVYLHGLDVVAPSPVYQRVWLPFIRRCDLALVNSANTARLAASRGVPTARLQVLHPGTDMAAAESASDARFRQAIGLGNRRVMLSVGRLTQRKGLVPFVTQAMPAVVARHPDVLLLMIGGEASDALHGRAGSERERILAAARQVGVENNVRLLGPCDDATLGEAYQAANLHIFPTLELPDDVEGFGMVALEAAAHGLPTVAFAVGGVPDAVRNGHTGWLVEAGNYPALAETISGILDQPIEATVSDACREFAADKAWPVFGERLRRLLEDFGDKHGTESVQ